MRHICLALLFVLSLQTAQEGSRVEEDLKAIAKRLDKALIDKDTLFLNQHLSAQLKYGHSNGWIETKDELKAHLFNGKLVYRSINGSGTGPTVVIEGKTGLVREEVTVDVLLDGKALNLKLSVLQVWIFRKGEWILLGRQSTKV